MFAKCIAWFLTLLGLIDESEPAPAPAPRLASPDVSGLDPAIPDEAFEILRRIAASVPSAVRRRPRPVELDLAA